MAGASLTPTRLSSPAASEGDLPLAGGGEEEELGAGAGEEDAAATPPPIAATAARIHRALLAEIEAVETMRAELKRRPQSPLDAHRTAGTLKTLYDTLHALERRQAGAAPSGQNNDDIPDDLDALREALAQRIDAFMASRGDEDFSGEGDGPATDRPVE